MAVTFKQRTLDNGLTIIAETDPAAHTSACGFFVRTGARDEDSRVMGVSHFLEHMMFKGTDRRSADDVNREFDELGASYNAFTTTEMTAFHAHVLPEFLPRAIDLLGDMMRPALRTEDFDTEKGVILEEIAMYKDNPFWVLYEEAIQRYYDEHGLGFRVLGTDQTVTDLQRDQMDDYFTSRYSADNTVVALAGRLDFDKACDDVAALCSKWQRTDATRDTSRPTPCSGDFELRDKNVNRGYLLAVSAAPSMQDDSRYAATMLGRILGEPGNSRLHWALVEPGIAEEAQAAFDAHDGCGDMFVYASGEPERLGDIRERMDEAIAGLADSLTEDDLERLRNKSATGVTLAGERPAGRMQRLGRLWPYLGEYRSLEEELDEINGVTLDDLRAVARDYPLSERMLGTLLPE